MDIYQIIAVGLWVIGISFAFIAVGIAFGFALHAGGRNDN